ncbi:polysaccharide deacetylase [Acetobacteraceae bacterium AT-5844]|nr:polysaccharide deacetylase [Acetobacteraceae bacterium AT-5844]
MAALAVPGAWPWALGAVALNHAMLTTAGMMPRSPWLGPNLSCLPETSAQCRQVALTFDDGPDPTLTPQVLALLERHGARASFFLIGERARRHPDLVRALLAAGHTAENHTDTHPLHFAALGMAAQRRQIERAQAAIEAVGGQPRYFRPPAGLRSPLLYPVLARLGLRHASWSRRGADGLLSDPARILRRLQGTQAGDVLLLHDGTWRPRGGRPPLLTVLPRLLAQLREQALEAVPLPDPEV